LLLPDSSLDTRSSDRSFCSSSIRGYPLHPAVKFWRGGRSRVRSARGKTRGRIRVGRCEVTARLSLKGTRFHLVGKSQGRVAKRSSYMGTVHTARPAPDMVRVIQSLITMSTLYRPGRSGNASSTQALFASVPAFAGKPERRPLSFFSKV